MSDGFGDYLIHKYTHNYSPRDTCGLCAPVHKPAGQWLRGHRLQVTTWRSGSWWTRFLRWFARRS